MTDRIEALEARVRLLLKAFALIEEADSDTGDIFWLKDSCARAVRITRREIVRLREGER